MKQTIMKAVNFGNKVCAFVVLNSAFFNFVTKSELYLVLDQDCDFFGGFNPINLFSLPRFCCVELLVLRPQLIRELLSETILR